MSDSDSKSNSGIDLLTLIGVIGAVVTSWNANHSVGWAIVHALLGWLYIIYFYLGLVWAVVIPVAFVALIVVIAVLVQRSL